MVGSFGGRLAEDGYETASTCSLSSRGRVIRVGRRQIVGRINWIFLLGAAVTGLALLLALFTGSQVRYPRTRVPAWGSMSRLPMLIAATIFGCLTVSGTCGLLILRNMKSLLDKWSYRVHTGIKVHLLISVMGVVIYASMYTFGEQLVIDTIDGGGHLIMRNIHWAVSNPLQWYIFSASFTKARRNDMVLIYQATCAMHVFGFLMLSMPTWPSFFVCFWAACGAFAVMFWQVFRLPLLPVASRMARRICWVQMFLWSGYPIATYFRHMGVISEWAEQVFLYTFLDCATKGVTFSCVIISRLVLTLASINGTMEFVLAANDLVLVLDEGYRLLDCLHGGAAIQAYFDLKSHRHSTLLDRCINEEHRERILRAAVTADRQPSGMPSPKCMVSFALRSGGGEVLAECLVSKAAQGRRVVGVAVTSVSGTYPSHSRTPSVSQAPSVRSELLSTASVARSFHDGSAMVSTAVIGQGNRLQEQQRPPAQYNLGSLLANDPS